MNLSLLSPLHASREAADRARIAHAAGRKPAPPVRAATIGGRPVEQVVGPYSRAGRVGIVSVSGVLEYGESVWSWLYGGLNTAALVQAIRMAADDSATDVILFDIECPGGDVAGMDDLDNAITYAKGKKYIAAIAHDTCCSAAYWLACRANELVATPTAVVGSIGVLLGPVIDSAAAAESEGVVVHYVSTGDLKAPGGMGQPVTPEQLENLRGVVEALFGRFIAAVADGREMDEEQIRGLRGGIFSGDALVESGLIDRIVSFDEFTSALMLRADRRQLRASTPAAGRVPGPAHQVRTQGAHAMAMTPEQWAGIDASSLATNRPDLVATIEQQVGAKIAEPPATVKALREAFPGDAEFALSAAERSLTLTQARAEYCEVLKARLAELQASAARGSGDKVVADMKAKLGAVGTVKASDLGVDADASAATKAKTFWGHVGEAMVAEKLTKAQAIVAVKARFPQLAVAG